MDTTADCMSELDQFDMDDCFWRPGAAIDRSFSLQMGISQRKSYLNSLSEQQAAREAESMGRSAPAGMPLPDSSASFAARRCMSWADTTTLVAEPSQELGPDISDEESDDRQEQSVRSTSQYSAARSLPRSVSGSYLSEGTAAAELFLRLNHARQTVSFVKKQAASYCKLDKAEMDVWQALGMLGELREYESALYDTPDLDPGMPLVEHAFQTAEACRLAYPEHDWLHLVGLLHSLGKLLGHRKVAVEPQWAICGEAFPVGCKFDPAISFSHFFGANPDRRSRTFNTPTGMYRPGGGLASVYMAWSYSEYLYMLLLMNGTKLPPEALFIIRYHKFLSLDVSHNYQALMGPSDRAMLPWLARFRQLSAYRRIDLPGALRGADFKNYYSALLHKYIPAGTLRF
jgi:inositol oxygenase